MAEIGVLYIIFLIVIFIVLPRWVLRVNHIVDRLDDIISLLDGKTIKEKAKHWTIKK